MKNRIFCAYLTSGDKLYGYVTRKEEAQIRKVMEDAILHRLCYIITLDDMVIDGEALAGVEFFDVDPGEE